MVHKALNKMSLYQPLYQIMMVIWPGDHFTNLIRENNYVTSLSLSTAAISGHMLYLQNHCHVFFPTTSKGRERPSVCIINTLTPSTALSWLWAEQPRPVLLFHSEHFQNTTRYACTQEYGGKGYSSPTIDSYSL